jgi:hypothetical protein
VRLTRHRGQPAIQPLIDEINGQVVPFAVKARALHTMVRVVGGVKGGGGWVVMVVEVVVVVVSGGACLVYVDGGLDETERGEGTVRPKLTGGSI